MNPVLWLLSLTTNQPWPCSNYTSQLSPFKLAESLFLIMVLDPEEWKTRSLRTSLASTWLLTTNYSPINRVNLSSPHFAWLVWKAYGPKCWNATYSTAHSGVQPIFPERFCHVFETKKTSKGNNSLREQSKQRLTPITPTDSVYNPTRPHSSSQRSSASIHKFLKRRFTLTVYFLGLTSLL